MTSTGRTRSCSDKKNSVPISLLKPSCRVNFPRVPFAQWCGIACAIARQCARDRPWRDNFPVFTTAVPMRVLRSMERALDLASPRRLHNQNNVPLNGTPLFGLEGRPHDVDEFVPLVCRHDNGPPCTHLCTATAYTH